MRRRSELGLASAPPPLWTSPSQSHTRQRLERGPCGMAPPEPHTQGGGLESGTLPAPASPSSGWRPAPRFAPNGEWPVGGRTGGPIQAYGMLACDTAADELVRPAPPHRTLRVNHSPPPLPQRPPSRSCGGAADPPPWPGGSSGGVGCPPSSPTKRAHKLAAPPGWKRPFVASQPSDCQSSPLLLVFATLQAVFTAVPPSPSPPPAPSLVRTSPRGWKQRQHQGAVPHARLGDRGALLTALRMPFKALFRQSNVHGGTHSF